MKTYQDLLAAGESGAEKTDFVQAAINEYRGSVMYKSAVDAEMYMRQENTTINAVVKMYIDALGRKVIDDISANFKIASNFLKIIVSQEVQYSLGNGVIFGKDGTAGRLGGEDLYNKLQDIGQKALVGGAAYGFYNYDKLEVFSAMEFVPLYDEENGSLSAGIRYWQIDENKPLRATLYELDGLTEYIKRKGGNMTVLKPKTSYKRIVSSTAADGDIIYDGGNYPAFPIVPCFANKERQSVLNSGLKSLIDAHDLIMSGFANTVEDAAMFYWLISNAGGMTDKDLLEFTKGVKERHTAFTNDENAKVEARTLDVPVNAREALLERIEGRIYEDAMALNIRQMITSNNLTATGIRASYTLLDQKADEFEGEVRKFIQGILKLAGIDDTFKFKRTLLVNQSEDTAMVLSAAQYLDDRTLLEKLPFIDDDEIDEVLKRKDAEEAERYEEEEDSDGSDEETNGINTANALEAAEDVVSKQLNGAQTQSLIAVMQQYASGVLTLGQAVNVIATAIGITKEEAKKIIEGAE